MKPQVAASRLSEIATLLEVRGENPFKARAFTQAARTLQGLEDEDISAMVLSKSIANLAGIGQTTLAVLTDLVESGDSGYLDQLRETTPEGLVEMLRIPGLGPTRIHRIHAGLGIETITELEAAARDGRLAGLEGFGLKTADRVLRGIASLRESAGQVLRSLATGEALRLRDSLAAIPGVESAEVAGSIRRANETVRDIDLVVEFADPDALDAALASLGGDSGVTSGTQSGRTIRLGSGIRADIYSVPRTRGGVSLWIATGSRVHCEKVSVLLAANGWSIRDGQLFSPDGRAVSGAGEEEIYQAAGLTWIPPELREDLGEVEAAATSSLPTLVTLSDIRGVLHCHSDYSDGTASVIGMARAAQARGWTYLGISDHSQSAVYAGGLDSDAVQRQHDEIDRANSELTHFRVLKGIEADILADGTVDYGPAVLDRFDYVIASVHSRFSMSEAQMTARILKAMDDPHVTILGHPTGRLLLAREAYPLNVEAVIEKAVESGVALELNCDPHRLDLDWRWLQVARRRGAKVELGPDAHSPDGLDYVEHGIGIARKGWLTPADILNAGSADEVLAFARRRHDSRGTAHGR